MPQKFNATGKTLIVSHNAGGAAALAAWVKHELNPARCDFALSGPALGIFCREFSALELVAINVELDAYSCVITATSAQDTRWETQVILRAKSKNIFCVSLLDHWTNYQSRFLVDGQYVYPDEIWVQDEFAQAIALSIADYPRVKLVDSFYLRDQAEAIIALVGKKKSMNGLNILLVTEPSTNPAYTEFIVLQDVLEYLAAKTIEPVCLRLRLHPRESRHKYDEVIQSSWFAHSSGVQVQLSDNTLIEDCAWSDWVVGCQTMAMVVALQAGLRVLCCLPACVEHCALPHTGIERIFPFDSAAI